jgi:hypothetical protein
MFTGVMHKDAIGPLGFFFLGIFVGNSYGFRDT